MAGAAAILAEAALGAARDEGHFRRARSVGGLGAHGLSHDIHRPRRLGLQGLRRPSGRTGLRRLGARRLRRGRDFQGLANLARRAGRSAAGS